MTFKELEELLNKEFVGKKYDNYGTRWDIRKFINEKILENDLDESAEEIVNQMIDDVAYTGFTGTFKTIKVPIMNI